MNQVNFSNTSNLSLSDWDISNISPDSRSNPNDRNDNEYQGIILGDDSHIGNFPMLNLSETGSESFESLLTSEDDMSIEPLFKSITGKILTPDRQIVSNSDKNNIISENVMIKPILSKCSTIDPGSERFTKSEGDIQV